MNLFLIMSMEKRRLWGRYLALVLFGVSILGGVAGCGKKADPIPLQVVVPPAVSDLRAERKDSGIKLHWSAAIPEGRFKILRSEQFPDEEICEGCPRHYVVLQEPVIGDPQLRYEKDSSTYSWIDSAVKIENSYFYRIVVCNVSGYCSEPSNPVDVPGKRSSEAK